MAQDPTLLLLLLAFGPPVLYLGLLALRHPGPSAGKALVGFGYGATMSIVVLALLYAALAVLLGDPVTAFQGFFAGRDIGAATQRDFVVIVVLAPLVEELAKGLGVVLLGWRLESGRDGVMLGAAVGLGFAGVETFLYLLLAFGDAGGVLARSTLLGLILLAGMRSVSAAFIHPAATGLTGLGIARARVAGHSVLRAFPHYLGAVALHGAYNFLAAFLVITLMPGAEAFGDLVNLLAALLLASFAWGFVKRAVATAA